MTTTVTVKGQVTLPKKVREAAGLRPGDKVNVRAEGGSVIVERACTSDREQEAAARVERAMADLQQRGIEPAATTDELMHLLRGDD
jgi:antitoxin PrlF